MNITNTESSFPLYYIWTAHEGEITTSYCIEHQQQHLHIQTHTTIIIQAYVLFICPGPTTISSVHSIKIHYADPQSSLYCISLASKHRRVRLRPQTASNKFQQQFRIQMCSNTNIVRTSYPSVRVNRRAVIAIVVFLGNARMRVKWQPHTILTVSNTNNTIKFKYTNNHTNVQTVRPGPTRTIPLVAWRSTTQQSRYHHCIWTTNKDRIRLHLILHQTPTNNTLKFKQTTCSITNILTSYSSMCNTPPFHNATHANQYTETS